MGKGTAIEWAHHTFNPWWGCVEVSSGCDHCYARTFAHRLGLAVWGKDAPRRHFTDKHWREPLAWNRAAEKAGARARVFCASMADVFEDRRDLDASRDRLWALIAETPALDWLLLTKRPDAMRRLWPWPQGAPPNVWAGVTVEDQARADARLPILLTIPAAVRWVSYEPSLGPIDFTPWLRCRFDHNGDGDCHIHRTGCPRVAWVVCGGESGPGARMFDVAWARSVIAQCRTAGAAYFGKQLGALPVDFTRMPHGGPITARDLAHPEMAETIGRQLDENCQAACLSLVDRKGGDMSEWSEDLRVREFPAVRP